MQSPPLILTLRINPDAQAFFNAQREVYFPPERNYLKAHITLFHHLPDNESTFAKLQNLQQKAFNVNVSQLIKLGNGVAYQLQSPALDHLHKKMKVLFDENLIPQDRQPFRPHVTIQNKVNPVVARKLFDELSPEFKPFGIQGIGIDVWRYLNGPWEHVLTYPFEK